MNAIRCFFAAAAISFAAMAPAAAEPITLTTGQALDLLAGLQSLDGRDEILKDGERQTTVKMPYKLGPGLRISIARNIVALQQVRQVYALARNGKFAELAQGKASLAPDTAEAAELTRATDAMLGSKQTVDLVKIDVKELALETNPLAGSVIAAIMPVLIGDGVDKAGK